MSTNVIHLKYAYASAAVVESIVGNVKIVLVYFPSGSKEILESFFSKPAVQKEFKSKERHYNWKDLEEEITQLLSSHSDQINLLVYDVELKNINRQGKTQAIAEAFELATQMFAMRLRIPLKQLIVRATRKIYPSAVACQTEKYYTDTYETKFAEWYAFLEYRKELNKKAGIYPEYEWEKNGGRATKQHVLAIIKHGPSPQHQRLFIKRIPRSLLKLILKGHEEAYEYLRYFEQDIIPHWWKSKERFIECLTRGEREELKRFQSKRLEQRRKQEEVAESYGRDFKEWLQSNKPIKELSEYERGDIYKKLKDKAKENSNDTK